MIRFAVWANVLGDQNLSLLTVVYIYFIYFIVKGRTLKSVMTL